MHGFQYWTRARPIIRGSWRRVAAFISPWGLYEWVRMLGFLSYYRQYIPNFLRTAKPLYKLLCTEEPSQSRAQGSSASRCKGKHKKSDQLHSSQPITWTEQHRGVLSQLLEHLLHPPLLGYPDFEKLFVLQTRDNKASWLLLVTGQEH